MNVPESVRSIRTLLLALWVATLATGVPSQGHTHHEDATPHLGAPGHGHGLVLVQYEMRLEKTGAIVFDAAISAAGRVDQAPGIVLAEVATADLDLCESRAPPGPRSRAPPA